MSKSDNWQISSQPLKRTYPLFGTKTVTCAILLAFCSVNIIQNSHNLNGYLSNIRAVQSNNVQQQILIQDNNNAQQQPIAWLMTFPNSGTTYTSLLVATVTGTYTATNYGQEKAVQGVPTENEILRRKSHSIMTDNPIPSWSVYSSEAIMPPTKGYILTKTHCGGYCFDCVAGRGAKDTQDAQSFFKACGRGQHVIQNTTSGEFRAINGYTPREKIGRIVHILRDPFDNVVARFHYHRNKMKEQTIGSEPWLEKYPNTRQGFRSYCTDFGEQWRAKEEKFYKDDDKNDVFDLVKDVPCLISRLLSLHAMA